MWKWSTPASVSCCGANCKARPAACCKQWAWRRRRPCSNSRERGPVRRQSAEVLVPRRLCEILTPYGRDRCGIVLSKTSQMHHLDNAGAQEVLLDHRRGHLLVLRHHQSQDTDEAPA